MDADLQHHAARHARGRVTPRAEIELAEPVAADIGHGIDHLAEHAGVDLLPDPTEMAFPPALIAEREHDARLAAARGDLATVGNRIGDGLVEEDMLAGFRRHARGLE